MTFAVNLAKLEAYVEQQGFTWQQVKAATKIQWYNHALAAGFDPNELKQFGRSKSVLRSALIKRIKQKILDGKMDAMLAHIRQAGTDDVTFPVICSLLEREAE